MGLNYPWKNTKGLFSCSPRPFYLAEKLLHLIILCKMPFWFRSYPESPQKHKYMRHKMQQMRDCFYLFILFCYKLDLPNFRKFSISERYLRQRIQIVRLDCLWFPEIETASSLSRAGKLHAYTRVSEDTPLKGRTESFKV